MLAYFDCFSGISGDMTLGALIDLGVPLAWLNETLGRIPLKGFDVTAEPVVRNGIRARRVRVIVEKGAPARNYSDIRDLIGAGRLPDVVRDRSLSAFDRIAEAESGIHGCAKEEVHFHEVGAVDSIVDIVGAMLCVDYLGLESVISSPLALGKGFVSCRHGILPVPVPATVAILKNVPVYGTDLPRELVTPTGAAIVTTLADKFGPMPSMRIGSCGYGAGSHDGGEVPNLLRVIIGRREDGDGAAGQDTVSVVEACIDDMNPEIFGYLMEQLFEDGALDVYWIPVFMKKNRPGTLVQVLCRETLREQVIRRLLSETTSLGVRHYPARRRMLQREATVVQTRFGELAAKRVIDTDGRVRLVPEYEACKQVALKRKIPLRRVYEAVVTAGNKASSDEQDLDK